MATRGFEHVHERDLERAVTSIRGAQPVSALFRRPTCTELDGCIGLLIPRKLKSPNETLWKHWRLKLRETRGWEADLQLAIGAFQRVARAERRKVAVTRLVPSRGAFIRDEDNLRFAVKPLNDALKRLGLIWDDSQGWLEQPLPVQSVSGDGHYWTAITIQTVPQEF